MNIYDEYYPFYGFSFGLELRILYRVKENMEQKSMGVLETAEALNNVAIELLKLGIISRYVYDYAT
jgi:hypothetical protein